MPPTITAWDSFQARARPSPRFPRRAGGSPMGNPPAGRSHWIASPTRRGRQCGGGSTWITRKGLRPEGWPRPFVIDATAASFLLILHYRGLGRKEFLDMCDYSLQDFPPLDSVILLLVYRAQTDSSL